MNHTGGHLLVEAERTLQVSSKDDGWFSMAFNKVFNDILHRFFSIFQDLMVFNLLFNCFFYIGFTSYGLVK